jgi:hypothetical protein
MIRSLLLLVFLCSAHPANSIEVADGIAVETVPAKVGAQVFSGISAVNDRVKVSLRKNHLSVHHVISKSELQGPRLPDDVTQLSTGFGMIVVWSTAVKDSDAAYVYEGNGTFRKLFTLDRKLAGLEVGPEGIIFSTVSEVFRWTPGSGASLIFSSSVVQGIRGVEVDWRRSIVYLATDDQVFAIRSGTADLLVSGTGGELLMKNDDLFVAGTAGKGYVIKSPAKLLAKKVK